jgi:signal transduction histidine kinase
MTGEESQQTMNWAPPEVGVPKLTSQIDQVLADERRVATRSASMVRLGNTILILVVIFANFVHTRNDAWANAMIPVTVYVVAALALFLLRNVPAAVRLAWLTSFVDVAAVGVILFAVLVASPSPAAVAALSLGLFGLIVASSSLMLRPAFVFLTAAAAALCDTWLLRSADLDWGMAAIACVVLFAVAATTQVSSRRISAVATGLALAEVSRQFEALRLENMTREKRTIETKLVSSQQQNDELIQLQQAKDTLAQVLVHDLRSPLTAVMATLDYIRMELVEAKVRPDLQQSAADALTQADRLTSMINDLLDVARLEEGRLQPTREDLSAKELCELVRAGSGALPRARKLLLEVDTAPGLRLDADRNLLRRALENLSGNAVRFAQRRVRISATKEGQNIVFRVQNDGPPLGARLHEHLFEKFVQGGAGRRLTVERVVLSARARAHEREESRGVAGQRKCHTTARMLIARIVR